MPLPLTLLAFALSGWLAVSTFRRLRRGDLGRGWWVSFTCLCILGLVVGWWMLHFEYRLSPTLRVVGVPLAIAVFQLEDGNWTDFIPNLQILIAVADVIVGVALCLLPLRLAAWLARRRSSMEI